MLLITYTLVNEAELRKKIIRQIGCIPSTVTVLTWFSFLLHHGVRPFQSVVEDSLHDQRIGFYLNPGKSGQKTDKHRNPIKNSKGQPIYWGKKDPLHYYFTSDLKIYADKISQFVCVADKNSGGSVINRLQAIFDHIFIDEIQDLAGYDLELVNLLLKCKSSLTMVGDPRQVTYLTHCPSKHKKYANGRIVDFIEQKTPPSVHCEIDESTLSKSHRNSAEICDYSNRLYPTFAGNYSCECGPCRPNVEHLGVFIVGPAHFAEYLSKYKPIQLRLDKSSYAFPGHPVMNMGASKGQTFDRVIIIPTPQMKNWIWDNTCNLANMTRAKFYVAITRARFSCAIYMDCPDDQQPAGLKRYLPLS